GELWCGVHRRAGGNTPWTPRGDRKARHCARSTHRALCSWPSTTLSRHSAWRDPTRGDPRLRGVPMTGFAGATPTRVTGGNHEGDADWPGADPFREKEGVFKVSAARSDLSVTVAGVHLTPPMGLT